MQARSRQRKVFAAVCIVVTLFVAASCGSVGEGTATLAVKEWGTAEGIETGDSGDANAARIAMDASGRAVSVWYQYDGLRNNIWANRFDGTNWGTAQLIETEDTGHAFDPQVAVNDTGVALAVWEQDDGTRYSIMANRFNGTAWETAGFIETDDSGDAFAPQIAMDGTGDAIAVWHQFDGTRDNIWISRFNGTLWAAAELLETLNTGDAVNPQIAMNADGKAMVVWEQEDGLRTDIRARYYNGTIWGSAQLIESDDTGDADFPQIAMDADGNAVAVWEQSDGIRTNIWTNFFDGISWSTAELIETVNAGDAEAPQIAMDTDGNAIAVWNQYDGTRDDIWANTYDGTAWGTAELIETGTGAAVLPRIAMNDDGNGIAVWEQSDGIRVNIRANRFNGSDWGTAELIEALDTGNAFEPQIAMDNNSNAIAVWHQYDGIRDNILANRFE